MRRTKTLPNREILASVTARLRELAEQEKKAAVEFVPKVRPGMTSEQLAEYQQIMRDKHRDHAGELVAFVRWLDSVERPISPADEDGGPYCYDCGDQLTAHPLGRGDGLLCESCDHVELVRLERESERPGFCWTCGHVHQLVRHTTHEQTSETGARTTVSESNVCMEMDCLCLDYQSSVMRLKADLQSIGAQRTHLGGGLAMYTIPPKKPEK